MDARLPAKPSESKKTRTIPGTSVKGLVLMGLIVSTCLLAGHAWLDRQRAESISRTMSEAFDKDSQRETLAYLSLVRKVLDARIAEAETQLNDGLKHRVVNAVRQIREIMKPTNTLTPEEKKHLIREALRPMRFSDGRSFFVIVDRSGKTELMPVDQTAEGKHYTEALARLSAVPFQEVLSRALQADNGFFTHPLSVDDQGASYHQKRWYYQTLPELDWILMVQDSLDLFTLKTQSEILRAASQLNMHPEIRLEITDGTRQLLSGTGTTSASPVSGQNAVVTLPLGYWNWSLRGIHMATPAQPLISNINETLTGLPAGYIVALCLLPLTLAAVAMLLGRWCSTPVTRDFRHFVQGLRAYVLNNHPIDLNEFRYREFRELAETANAFSHQRTLLLRELERQSQRDPLTDLYNRRHMSEILVLEEARIVRNKRSFAVIMADIDSFKQINDTFGHDAGDTVIRSVSRRIRNAVRRQDQVSRWGGEEFLVLLPDATPDSARTVAEKIRRVISDAEIIYNGNRLNITMTFGVAIHTSERELTETLKHADMALYEGKRQGRNCVVSAKPLVVANTSYA